MDNTSHPKRDRSRDFGKGRDTRTPSLREPVPDSVVFGRNAVKELLATGRDIDKIFVQSGEHEGSIRQLIGIAGERHIPVIETERAKLDALTGRGAHQGIVAMAAEQEYVSVKDILDYAASRGEKPFLILCDGIEDPHNLGAIIRSAECAGAHGIIIPKRRNVGLTSTVAKASAGAISHMRIAKVVNLAETIEELKEEGIWFYAADMDGKPFYDTDLGGGVGLVLGSEGDGISRLVKEKCDFVLSIPMYGKVNSMNVSCAAAVLMCEVARQRTK